MKITEVAEGDLTWGEMKNIVKYLKFNDLMKYISKMYENNF